MGPRPALTYEIGRRHWTKRRDEGWGIIFEREHGGLRFFIHMSLDGDGWQLRTEFVTRSPTGHARRRALFFSEHCAPENAMASADLAAAHFIEAAVLLLGDA